MTQQLPATDCAFGMEHLVFQPDIPRETASAYHENILRSDWQHFDNLIDFVPERTLWLGFDHDKIPLGKLAQYATAAGFDEVGLWNAHFRESRPDFQELSGDEIGRRVAALFQAWLYYGLLESVAGKKVHVSYMMRQDTDGKDYLYSRNLHFCLQAKVFKIRQNPECKSQVNRDIHFDLGLVQKWMSRFTAWCHPSFRPKLNKDYPGFMDLLDAIIPSIVRLAEAVLQMRLFVLPDYPSEEKLGLHYPDKIAEQRRSKLHYLGWCLFQIRLLDDTLNHSTIDYIVGIGMRQDPIGHETCTIEACARNNIDESTYQQAHVCGNHKCEKLFPDLKTVEDILRADMIPIMRLETINGKYHLRVKAASNNNRIDYIAVSHVWADGLGGKTESGLNQCQIERLRKLCTSISETANNAWFWVDSLGIPRRDKNIYYKALVGIRDVYINASAVLVIDKTIEECTTSSTTEVLYAHIYLSAWMQRMWTYEEAVLSKKLIFALKDGFHTYDHVTWPSIRQTVSVVWQSLATQLYRLQVKQDKLSIGHIQKAFRYRLTNAPQEEFLSVSGMLGLDTQKLLAEKGEERTKAFWLMLKRVPSSILHLDCPRLSEPGFRWAPKTMMFPTRLGLNTDDKPKICECTTEGLVGTYLTVSLKPPLKGSAAGTGSIFYIWVQSSDDTITSPGDHRALLRVYCVESWPKPPDELEFETIALENETKEIIDAGQWVSGAALSSQDINVDNKQAQSPSTTSIGTFQYIGRVLIERIQDREMASSSGTVMFEGSSKVVINTQGVWIAKKLCIT
jgi:hypothetical protein